MTAVIYARYSSDNQREESIEGQIRECTAYAEKNDITIVKHYIDRAISAKTDNRPQFQQMIKDSDKKLFDIVLVWKLDRFARNRYDSARYKTQLKKNGVKLMSATEIISEGPEGIILESVLEGYAEYYSADLAEKVVRGQTENILKGRCNGGRGTFGYTLDSERKFHIDPLASPFVLESFTKYRDGLTMKEIRDWLNENGIKNPVGGEFTYNSVEHMLKNRRYIGELKFRDVVVPDAIPPIVPLELFDDVQEKIAKNKKAPARRKAEDDYLLTTKLHCGCCGALMFGESGTSRTGEVHRYYKCATAKKKKGCKKKTVRKQWLEDLVVNQTMQLVRDDAAMESIIAKVMELQDRENTNLPLYEKQLRDAESGIQNMLNAIQAGILTSSTKERLEQLEETKRELEARIAEEKLAKPKIKEEFIRFWLMRFRKLDMSLKDQRQALVDTFINSIYLYDDKVLITFNYKEGTQTITFEEAAQAASKENGSDLDCFTAPRKTHTHCVLVFLFRCGRGLEQQRRRPQPAAETGRSCWGRVLIFQSPAKGLQKNQQTQPVRPCTAGQAISPAGCCLVRGSQRVGMSNNRLRFSARREDSNKAAAHSAASKATARLCLACGCQPVGMSNKRTTVHPGKNRTVLKPVKHIRVLVFLFSVRREDSSYPFLFFIQMRYSPSVMRVSRYRMGVQHASRMGMGRLPVA